MGGSVQERSIPQVRGQIFAAVFVRWPGRTSRFRRQVQLFTDSRLHAGRLTGAADAIQVIELIPVAAGVLP